MVDEYKIMIERPDLLAPDPVEEVLTVARKGPVCLSDLKRDLYLPYDVIRAALHFLQSHGFLEIVGRNRGLRSEQLAVKATDSGNRISISQLRDLVVKSAETGHSTRDNA